MTSTSHEPSPALASLFFELALRSHKSPRPHKLQSQTAESDIDFESLMDPDDVYFSAAALLDDAR